MSAEPDEEEVLDFGDDGGHEYADGVNDDEQLLDEADEPEYYDAEEYDQAGAAGVDDLLHEDDDDGLGTLGESLVNFRTSSDAWLALERRASGGFKVVGVCCLLLSLLLPGEDDDQDDQQDQQQQQQQQDQGSKQHAEATGADAGGGPQDSKGQQDPEQPGGSGGRRIDLTKSSNRVSTGWAAGQH